MIKSNGVFSDINIFYESGKFQITDEEARKYLSDNGNFGNKKLKTDQSSDDSELENFQLLFEEVLYIGHKYSEFVHVYDEFYNEIELSSLWVEALNNIGSKFPVLFAAYNYYRSKGWIVKKGHIFGVDYLLYEEDIDKCHAKYSVLVRYAQKYDDIKISNEELFAKIRLTNSVHKILKYCWITGESRNFDDNSTVDTTNVCTVHEVSMTRFVFL